jgi:hypothetical protein
MFPFHKLELLAFGKDFYKGREREGKEKGGFLVIYESTLYVGGRGTFLFMFIELKRRVL